LIRYSVVNTLDFEKFGSDKDKFSQVPHDPRRGRIDSFTVTAVALLSQERVRAMKKLSFNPKQL
jgi:hypothetical protein